MTQSDVVSIMREAIYTTMVAAAPMLLIAVIVGLIVSIFQATTQINEQTLAFIPKIVGVFLGLLFFSAFIFNTINSFTVRMYGYIPNFLS